MRPTVCFTLCFIILFACGPKKGEIKSDRVDSVAVNSLAAKFNEAVARGIIILDDECEYCDVGIDNHIMSIDEAAILIKDFQDTFPGLNVYGGTIYFNPEGLTLQASDTILTSNYTSMKYHFCGADETNPDGNMYLALQQDECVEGQRFDTSVTQNCEVSDTRNWVSRFSAEDRSNIFIFRTKLANHLIPRPSGTLNQSMLMKDVLADKNKLIGFPQNRFARCINCSSYAGNFRERESIGDISQEVDLQGNRICAGYRYYYGLIKTNRRGENRIKVILIGVDINGQNLRTCRETSRPHL